MRRNRASGGVDVITRKGVTASTRHSARNVQSPVARINASAGLAPN